MSGPWGWTAPVSAAGWLVLQWVAHSAQLLGQSLVAHSAQPLEQSLVACSGHPLQQSLVAHSRQLERQSERRLATLLAEEWAAKKD